MLKYLLMNNVISMWFWINCKKSPQGLYHGIDWNLCWQEMSGKSQGIFFCQPHGNSLVALQWRHDGHGSISNHHPYDCLLSRLFRCRSKKTSKLRVTGLCAGNSPGTGDIPAQMASNAENVSIWWRHHGLVPSGTLRDVVVNFQSVIFERMSQVEFMSSCDIFLGEHHWTPLMITQIAKFMGPTWGPPGSCRTQMGPMLAPWTLLSGKSTLFQVMVWCCWTSSLNLG